MPLNVTKLKKVYSKLTQGFEEHFWGHNKRITKNAFNTPAISWSYRQDHNWEAADWQLRMDRIVSVDTVNAMGSIV